MKPKHRIKQTLSVLLVLSLLFALGCGGKETTAQSTSAPAEAPKTEVIVDVSQPEETPWEDLSAGYEKEATILFTHDLHSHLLPVKTQAGTESGGYARLYTALEQERKQYADTAVLTVDGGDFSMGSLFQTVFTSSAAELRILGNLGYDAVTFGNHEFDFRQQGLASMLRAAAEARAQGETLPALVQANYYPVPLDSEGCTDSDRAAWEALEQYGVTEYTIVERNGVRFGIFGLLGADADGDSPMSGMVFEDTAAAAARMVALLQEAQADYIICLSHSGTNEESDKSEDEQLALAVEGIDVIVSGHTHSTLIAPIEKNGTLIVSCGCYAQNLGEVRIAKDEEGKTVLLDYQLLPITEELEEDEGISALIEGYKAEVAEQYLSAFAGMETFDKVLLHTDFALDSAGGETADKALGNLITESYFYAMAAYGAEGYDPVDVALIPCGVIRGTLPVGDVTVSDAFDVLSLGVGADGTAGYPLVSMYLTGKDLKTGFEIDASVSPSLPIAQLYMTGVYWTWNPDAPMGQKVTDCGLVLADGTVVPIEDDKLYHCVTGQNCCQMLGKVGAASGGALTVTPRDKNGVPIEDGGTFDSCIIYDRQGRELKEWYAFASYLASFTDPNGDGVADLPDVYRQPRGTKLPVAAE